MELTNKNEKDYIELSSSDNKIFYINRRTASLSKQLEPLFEMDGLNEQIKLNNVSAGVLEKMIKFCKSILNLIIGEFHSEIPFMDIEKPLKSDVLSECISDWDNAFLKQFKQEELIEMLYAANYLEIQSLLDLGYITK